jgi:hypothetical protein
MTKKTPLNESAKSFRFKTLPPDHPLRKRGYVMTGNTSAMLDGKSQEKPGADTPPAGKNEP